MAWHEQGLASYQGATRSGLSRVHRTRTPSPNGACLKARPARSIARNATVSTVSTVSTARPTACRSPTRTAASILRGDGHRASAEREDRRAHPFRRAGPGGRDDDDRRAFAPLRAARRSPSIYENLPSSIRPQDNEEGTRQALEKLCDVRCQSIASADLSRGYATTSPATGTILTAALVVRTGKATTPQPARLAGRCHDQQGTHQAHG